MSKLPVLVSAEIENLLPCERLNGGNMRKLV